MSLSKTLRGLALISATAMAASCATEDNANHTYDADSAALTGYVFDDSGAPVANAKIAMVIGETPVTSAVESDDNGLYELRGVPVARVREALESGEEITLTIHSPATDLEPFGTAEGDRVYLTPISLRQFSKIETLMEGRETIVRPATVPLQASGHAITDELIANGGRLNWAFADSPAGPIEVSLVIQPGAIQITSDEAQREITLTPIDPMNAPMQIPEGGYGPLWTIQPRGIVFDPPAKVQIKGERMALLGLANAELGETYELYGASLEQGWELFGDVEVVENAAGDVTLESTAGVIKRGAWGHVFSNNSTDAGTLVTCRDAATNDPIPCFVADDNWSDTQSGHVAITQRDYNNTHREFYDTDLESVCSGCTSIGAPQAQLALGINICTHASDQADCMANPAPYAQEVKIIVYRLCGEAAATNNIDERDAVRFLWPYGVSDPENIPSAEYTGYIAARSFAYGANFQLGPCSQ